MLEPESPPPISEDELRIKQELAEALRLKNFVRAELLARQAKRPDQEIKELQKKALHQFIVEFRNAEGVIALTQEYQFHQSRIKKLFPGANSSIGRDKTI